MIPMIPIVIQNESPFIWNANDWLKIREEHRIIGNLTGCLVGLPRQETFQGLPLTLLKEEVTLLLDKGLAYVISDSHLSGPPDEKTEQRFLTYKEKNKKEQIACYEDQRKKQITMMIDRIVEGKRRKLLGLSTKKIKMSSGENSDAGEIPALECELNKEEILKNELDKGCANLSPPMLVQTFTGEPLVYSDYRSAVWEFPKTAQENLRYSIFNDLWNKGFYITDGHKFGVDYLVYPGDPVKFHAQFLVVCMEYNENFSALDMISYARLGSISRKTFVIATKPTDSENILYQSIQWTEKN